MLELVDGAPDGAARRDAVTDALAMLGQPQACTDDDRRLASSVFDRFRSAQRRRARVRTVGVLGLAAAAAIALTWYVVPQLRGRGFEVDQGEFLVQQGRVTSGSHVAAGEWMEADGGRACVRVAARRVCGEAGARLRVLDDDTVELDRGGVSADGALDVITPVGEVHGAAGGFDLALDEGGLQIGAAAVTITQHGATVEIAAGTLVTLGGAEDPRVATRPPVAPVPEAEPEPTIEASTAGPAVESPRATPRSSRPATTVEVPSAGELLAAARDLAGRGKLGPAATAYQRLLDAYPQSSESRAALVSLGRVQADRGRHAAALSAFSRYLDGGAGPLGEEAHYGRIQALHALGRVADRDRAIEALAAAHPRSVYLTRARKLAGP